MLFIILSSLLLLNIAIVFYLVILGGSSMKTKRKRIVDVIISIFILGAMGITLFYYLNLWSNNSAKAQAMATDVIELPQNHPDISQLVVIQHIDI